MSAPKYVVIIILFSSCIVYSRNTPEGDIGRETLKGCSLRHGVQELPEKGSPGSINNKGYIFSFKTNKLGIDSFTKNDTEYKSFNEFRKTLVRENTGDLYYEKVGDTKYLFSVSGRIKELGKKHLFEFNNRRLRRPGVSRIKENKEVLEGWIENVELGYCYLIESTYNSFILFRVIGFPEGGRSCLIQWVEAKGSKPLFSIPETGLTSPSDREQEIREARLKQELEDARKKTIDTSILPEIKRLQVKQMQSRNEFRKYIDTYCTNRKGFIQFLMKVVDDDNMENSLRVQAVKTLGKIRASESAAILCKNICFQDTTSLSSEFNLLNSYPVASALSLIGKPGVRVSIDAILKLTKKEKEHPWHAKLLTRVIVKVEGERIARILLNDILQTAKTKKEKGNIQLAIKTIDKVKSW